LPSGFRSQPTDQELILHYLSKRAASLPCPAPIIAEVDIYKFEPWDLPAKATFGKDEWYFYHRNYYQPNSMRLNRRAGCGYWKSTGAGKPIHSTVTGESVGVKNALVFYKGRPPTGTKSNWIMYEYRLADSTNMSTINTITGSSSRSSTPVRAYCRQSCVHLIDLPLKLTFCVHSCKTGCCAKSTRSLGVIPGSPHGLGNTTSKATTTSGCQVFHPKPMTSRTARPPRSPWRNSLRRHSHRWSRRQHQQKLPAASSSYQAAKAVERELLYY
jgi:hypothetical protein